MDWIGSQPPEVITLIAFVLCYAVAALIFGIIRFLSRMRAAEGLQAITPAMVTPIGVIGGLLIAFLAGRVWANLDNAITMLRKRRMRSVSWTVWPRRCRLRFARWCVVGCRHM